MGCASSSPMVQTSGSEILKAATHVASDATKTAEDAVEGVKESVGKSLETAKDTVATTIDGVKHEVENVVKEKSDQLDEAKNTLMEKLHLKSTNNGDKNAETKTETDTINTSNTDIETNKKAEDENAIDKTDMNELKTQLKESDVVGIAETEEETMKHILTRTDTETDSLKTSTPEPEIEQALAKGKDNRTGVGDGNGDNDDDDDDDNPPTPKPTLKELENLTAEVLKEQQLQLQQEHIIDMAVNNLKSANNTTDDPAELIKNIKTSDNSNIKTAQIIDSNTITHNMLKDNDTLTNAAAATTAITTTNNDNKTNTNMHKTAPMDAVVVHQTFSSLQHPVPLMPLTLATTDIAFATTAASSDAAKNRECTMEMQILQQKPLKSLKREEKPKAKKSPIAKTNTDTEEKRPRTTEWEKFADMLALQRKFNPHNAFRRNGTLTKFGGGQKLSERPSHFGQHTLAPLNDDDSSDTTSNFRSSPVNSQHSSARVGGRVQRLPNRPNTGNNRKNHREFTNSNGSGHSQNNRNRHNAGRKFDFNPNRLRTNDAILSVSSDPFIDTSLETNTETTQLPNALTTSSHLYESVKSPTNRRSHHSRSDTRQLPPLEQQNELNAQQQQQLRYNHVYDFNQQSALHRNETKSNTENIILTRESSNTSLFSNGSIEMSSHQSQTLKMSQMDLRSNLSTHPPVKNTSSFLSTPRSSPFSIRKSYTDLYFSATNNKENKSQALSMKNLKVPQQLRISRDKSPHNVRKRSDQCSKKNSKK